MQTTQVAVDLAKSVFEVAISYEPGRVAQQRRLNRAKFRQFLERQEPSEILMEACGTAHYWGRECQAMGHRVRLLPGGDVGRYRDGNKTDRTDTKALLEAARNDRIDAVPVKVRGPAGDSPPCIGSAPATCGRGPPGSTRSGGTCASSG